MYNPTAGSPTITLFQLHSGYHIRLDPQILVFLKIYNRCYLWLKIKTQTKFIRFPKNTTLRA